jgi:hypothetical protein
MFLLVRDINGQLVVGENTGLLLVKATGYSTVHRPIKKWGLSKS